MKNLSVFFALLVCLFPGRVSALRGSVVEPDEDNKTCMTCHGEKGKKARFVDEKPFAASVHAKVLCVSCHSKIKVVPCGKQAPVSCAMCHRKQGNAYWNSDHGRATVNGAPAASCQDCHGESHAILRPKDARSKVNRQNVSATCARCHDDPKRMAGTHPTERAPYAAYKQTVHGEAFARGDAKAPVCSDCHGAHDIFISSNTASRTSKKNIPETCGRCHQGAAQAYRESVHGQVLEKAGLVTVAVCSDCHTGHDTRRSKDAASSINRVRVAATCGRCHEGLSAAWSESAHGKAFAKNNALALTCIRCHGSHRITRAGTEEFRVASSALCGKCHGSRMKSYSDTYHGRVNHLGYVETAKCFDCHGSHLILPAKDPRSTISPDNKVQTCRKCHSHATESFTDYIAHGPNGTVRTEVLYWTMFFMSALLIGTFAFFGAHTLLWAYRLISDGRLRESPKKAKSSDGIYVQRFPLYHRILHVAVIVSFIGLVLTGMPLRFPHARWAILLTHLEGGFRAAGLIHRFCAIITFLYMGAHLVFVVRYLVDHPDFDLFGPDSMLPRRKDLSDFVGHVRWFVRRGPHPRFDRWTYWEKFDYWAVFWGVTIIGSSGLVLWFPQFFAQFLPGWVANVATVVHADEALLAAGFIFTMHFFHTHFRPEKFPIDDVIFTGRLSLEELKNERPEEYERLVAEGRLDELVRQRPSPGERALILIFAFTALALGVAAILLIAYALL